MKKSLNEIYLEKKVKLIVEKFDPKKLQKFMKNISLLEKTIMPYKSKLKNLTLAINAAKAKAGKLSIEDGGFFKNLLSNLGLVDDLKEFAVFQTSIMEGLKSFPLIVTALQQADVDLESDIPIKTLLEKSNLESITKVFAEAMLPTKWFGGSDRTIPFVRSINDLAKDFVNLSPAEIFDIAERSSSFENEKVDMDFMKSLYQASKNIDSEKPPTVGELNPKDEKFIDNLIGTEIDLSSLKPSTPSGKKSFDDVIKTLGIEKDVNDPNNKATKDLLMKFYSELTK